MTIHHQTCNTCGHDASQPFRSYSPDGKIVHGCIDAFHDNALTPFSVSHAWHYRKEAKAYRIQVAKRQKELLK